MKRMWLAMWTLVMGTSCISDSELPEGDWDYLPKELLFQTQIGRTTTEFFTISNNRNNAIELTISRPIPDGNCPEEPFLQPPRLVRIAANSSQEIAIGHAPQMLPDSGNCSFLLNLSSPDDESTGRRTLRLSGQVDDIDADGDGWGRGEGDCVDRLDVENSAEINPGAQEICDSIDNDCDGFVDDDDVNEFEKWSQFPELLPVDADGEAILPDPLIGGQQVFWPDNDQDFYPRSTGGRLFCDAPVGFIPEPTAAQAMENNGGWDCNDQLPDIYPGAFELAGEGIDRDCDDAVSCYNDSDLDTFGDVSTVVAHPLSLNDPFCLADGVSDDSLDCDDGNASVNPNQVEICNAIDDDCDGLQDDADPSTFNREVWFYDGDADGEGIAAISTLGCVQPASYVANALDCNDANPAINSSADEVCDGVDNDCNGIPDDEPVDPLPWFVDTDGDGYGDATVVTPASVSDPTPPGFIWSCSQPLGYSLQNTDCNDGSSLESPGAPEITGDGIDQDCDGLETCFVDQDGDSYGLAQVVEVPDADPALLGFQCPPGTADRAGDCNDTVDPLNPDADGDDAAPGVQEVCDGIDNDCDNKIDDADETLNVNLQWLRDADGDGFGDPGLVVFACDSPAGFVAYNPAVDDVDCDDDDASAKPGGVEEPADGIDGDCNGTEDCYEDLDGDGFGTATLVQGNFRCATVGASSFNTDCDDAEPLYNPAAFERCEGAGIDEDCDGLVNDLDPDAIDGQTYYLDADGDGWGTGNVTVSRCAAPPSYVEVPGDCNDTTSDVAPGRQELCNGADDDCDGFIDDADSDLDPNDASSGALSWYRDGDNDGYGTAADTLKRCNQPVGYVSASGDCDDLIRETNPGAGEGIGDDVDQNCDGDELCYEDLDGDTWGSAAVILVPVASGCDAPGVSASKTGDCDDTEATVAPSEVEVCDGVDNDCDFLVDDADDDVQPDGGDLRLLWLRDADNDGFGDPGNTRLACTQPAGFENYYQDPTQPVPVQAETDCDDTNFNIKPGVAELPADDVDQNCNGQESCYEDADGDGYGTSVVTSEQAGDALCRAPGRSAREDDCDDINGSVFPGAVEICNGDVDDDCNGLADDLDGDVLDGDLWFRDGDGDGFGNPSISVRRCVGPAAFVANASDCNDLRDDVSPAAPELCDNLDLDNDCDGAPDDLDLDIDYTLPGVQAVLWYPDADGDSYGEKDDDGDGFGDQTGVALRLGCDATLFEVPNDQDCDDNNAAVRPGALEQPGDQIDQNCDGEESCFVDADGDTYGDSALVQSTALPGWCANPGFATRGGDCDDGNASATTSQTPYFYDNDGDGFGNPNVLRIECGDPGPEWVDNASDCDDGRDFINPDALERCDELDLDENCNGIVDDLDRLSNPGNFDNSTLSSFYPDADSDGFGELGGTVILACDPGRNQVDDQSDCDDTNVDVRPGVSEIIGDGIDQNCDGDESCFADGDSDGFGDGTVVSVVDYFTNGLGSCAAAGFADVAGDCDDGEPAIGPLAVEVCNGVDDDCDTRIDDADDDVEPDETDRSQTWWFDADGDGYGNPGFTVYQCSRPVGFVPWPADSGGVYLTPAAAQDEADCEDADFTIRPGATELPGDRRDQNCDGDEECYVDGDGDGVGSNTTATVVDFFVNGLNSCTDEPNRANVPGDCNDANPAESSGGGTSFFDGDGDGFGDPSNSFVGCNAPGGYVGNSSDCNDLDFDIKPGGDETTCDGADSDCDGLVDEDSSFDIFFYDGDDDDVGTNLVTQFACLDPGEEWELVQGDCNDLDANIRPGVPDDDCDGVDENCSGVADEGSIFALYYPDVDGDTYGASGVGLFLCEPPSITGWVTRGEDCNDDDSSVSPAALEICNDRDDDCDGEADEGIGNPWYRDGDGDGFGAGIPQFACDPPPGFVADESDCNDANATAFPGAPEVCDGVDNDCVGGPDNGITVPTWYPDADGDGARDDSGATQVACEAPFGFLAASAPVDCNDGDAAVSPAASEVCNGIDDDCDTAVDQGASCGDRAIRVVIDGGTYQFFDDEVTWWTAADVCDSIGYDLLRLNSDQERDDVMAWAQLLLLDGNDATYWLGYGFETCPASTSWQVVDGAVCTELASLPAGQRSYAEAAVSSLSPDPGDQVYMELSESDFQSGSQDPEWLLFAGDANEELRFVCEAP